MPVGSIQSAYYSFMLRCTMTSPSSSSCTFWLRFADVGVLQGSVDADDLSQALAAANDVFDCINRIANNGETTASLRVDEGIRQDGFAVGLSLIQSSSSQTSFLDSVCPDGDLGAQQAVQVLLQLLMLKRKLKGLPPLKTVAAAHPGFVQVFADLETVIEVWELTLRCYENSDCARAVARLAAPLRRGKGTTSLTLALGSEEQTLRTDEAAAFNAGKTGAGKSDAILRLTVEIEAPSFRAGRKWQINLGSTSVAADLDDPAFWQRLEQRLEVFGCGDSLDYDLAVTRTNDGGKMKSTYRIVKVHGHVSAAEQPTLI